MRGIDLLERTYAGIHAVLAELDAEAEWAPTGCTGWTVRDLVQHLLGDARRALVAVGTPADRPPDTDAVSYWRSWSPGTEASFAERRLTRVVSGVWPTLEPLRQAYAETCAAAVHLLRITDPVEPVSTQGHVLTVDDLTRTLVFEAAVHHLDMVAYLDAPGPGADARAARALRVGRSDVRARRYGATADSPGRPWGPRLPRRAVSAHRLRAPADSRGVARRILMHLC
jgi:hypothetical protein